MSPGYTINEGATATVAAFIANSKAESIPEAVAYMARRAIANWVACALGAVNEPAVAQVMQVAMKLSGRSDSSIVGCNVTLDPVNAALVNGVAANALDYDDMHAATLIHPTGAVVAAALALAEARGSPGRALLTATVAGIEVECRIGTALFPAHYDAGWHITATLGTLGAAAAACVILGLDEQRTRHALGIASTLSGGLRSMLTSSSKSLNIGKAAAAGVTAALLAEANFDSDPEALEAKFGFFHVFGQPRSGVAFVAPPSGYALLDVSLKPYPCGIVVHPLIDSCIALAQEHGPQLDRVHRISIAVHARAVELANRQHPATAVEGRYSLQHAAALAFTRGSAGLRDFEQAQVKDPVLHAWRDRMVVAADPSLSPAEACVVVELADGARLEHVTRFPSGSPERPLSAAHLERKFMELAARALDRAAAEALYADCCRLDQLEDVNVLRRHWSSLHRVSAAGQT